MELLSRNLFIDTHYFITRSFDFKDKDLSALVELAQKDLIAVFITDITKLEVIKKIEDEIGGAFKKINHSDTRYLKALPLYKKFISTYTEHRAIAYLVDEFNNFLKRCKITIVPSSKVKLLDVFSSYCRSEGAFASDSHKNRKYEYPDAFALMTIDKWCASKRQKTYLLSGDSDWELYAKGKEYLLHIQNLPELLNTVIRNEEALEDLTAFSDHLLTVHMDEVREAIKQHLSEAYFEVDSWEDIDILDHGILEVEIKEKEITTLHRDGSSYTLNTEVKGIFSCEVPNYEASPYDSEDKEYLYIETSTVYILSIFEVQIDIEIGFDEGIPGNFELLHLSSTDTISIEYDGQEVVDLQEWVKTLPVIVCGVQDGGITDSGSGVENFLNISEAQKAFPSLDIWKPSKEFTQAMGNKLTGPLRFESWAANKLYSD